MHHVKSIGQSSEMLNFFLKFDALVAIFYSETNLV
jgi:hypothetical protein